MLTVVVEKDEDDVLCPRCLEGNRLSALSLPSASEDDDLPKKPDAFGIRIDLKGSDEL